MFGEGEDLFNMAGYIFNIGKKIDVKKIIEKGYYSTFINYSIKKNNQYIQAAPFEATYADYTSMKAGDNVYFFQKRKIFGVGKLVNVLEDCKYNNFPGASKSIVYSNDLIKDKALIDFGKDTHQYRWICFFEGSPNFYNEGIDMDEVLEYKPTTFKSLRTNWKKSFVKIDDYENQSLKELFCLRCNGKSDIINISFDKNKVENKINENYKLNYKDLISNCIYEDKLLHEMALEAATIEKMSLNENDIFGKWDFKTHQVCASPFKPVDYMDKMDIFAYKYTEADGFKVISKFMVIELKADVANCDTIAQVTNYVDWICNNYAYGDYSLIEAYILAYSFKDDMYENVNKYIRTYNMGSHPVKSLVWDNIKFIKYRIAEGTVNYIDVTKKED